MFKTNLIRKCQKLCYSTVQSTAPACSGFSFNQATKPTVLQSFSLKNQIDYNTAGTEMEKYVRRALDFKAGKLNQFDPPLPLLLNYEMTPVYTSGRRQHVTNEGDQSLEHNGEVAQFIHTSRGGQTTFHGPGQLVVYPIIDLRAFGIPPRCYVSLLEKSIINTLDRYGIKAMTTENTGVWINDDEKIAAIGVQCRRNITSHGIALNINTDTWWFDKIIACGLPDKKTTTMSNLGVDTTVNEVCDVFSQEIAKQLECKLIDF